MFKVTVQGISGVKAQFATAVEDIKAIVSEEVEEMAREFVAGAKRDAPADQSTLRSGISYLINGNRAEIFSNVFYSPFMEFGTKGKYRPIPGTETIAEQFKGYKGGDFMELLRMITKWVARKGITGVYSVKSRKRTGSKIDQLAENYSAAWPIAMSILKYGVNPHPYFFKQQDTVWPAMIRRIESRLRQKTKVAVQLPGSVKTPKIITI